MEIGAEIPVVDFLHKDLFKTHIEGLVDHLVVFPLGDPPSRAADRP